MPFLRLFRVYRRLKQQFKASSIVQSVSFGLFYPRLPILSFPLKKLTFKSQFQFDHINDRQKWKQQTTLQLCRADCDGNCGKKTMPLHNFPIPDLFHFAIKSSKTFDYKTRQPIKKQTNLTANTLKSIYKV